MAKRGKPRTSPAAAAKAMTRLERDKAIWQRRLEEASISEIAAEFSLSKGRVHAMLARDEQKIESSKQELVLETFANQVDHLDTLLGVAMTKATSAEGGASDIQAAAKVIQVQAEVIGTKAATRAEITGANGGPLQSQTSSVVMDASGLDLSLLTVDELKTVNETVAIIAKYQARAAGGADVDS